MALTSTMHVFSLDISDVDRGVYTQVEVRVARHPSETLPFLVTRVLAFALSYEEGLAFGKGVSTAEEPALWRKDDTGHITLWIDVGQPAAERLHKASKRADVVQVYTHRDVDQVLGKWAGTSIHRADELSLVGVPDTLVGPLEAAVDRRNTWSIMRTDSEVYVTVGSATMTGTLQTRMAG